VFRDKILLAGIAGLIGILADEVIEWGAFLLKLTDRITIHMIGSIMYSSLQLNSTQILIGEVAHLIAGFVLGIIPLVFYLWSGKEYPVLKGAGIGAGLWLNHSIFIPSFVDARIHLIPTTASLIVELIAITLWGIASYGFIVRNCYQNNMGD
jgi:hypothetical protein